MTIQKIAAAIGVSAALLAPVTAQAIPSIWEPTFGATLTSGDDATFNLSFGFLFPFLGTSYSGAIGSTNGFLSLGASNGSGCCDGNVSGLLGGAPRIAPAWYDQVHTVYLNTAVAGRAVVTWSGTEFSNSSVVLYQAHLFSSGNIIFAYDTLPPLEDGNGHRHDALVGVSGGGGAADPGETNFSSALPLDSGAVGTVYEFFARGPNGATGGSGIDTFDLAQTNICFNPNSSGGFGVNQCANVPEPGSLPLFAAAFGGIAWLARRRQSRK